jgi:hypothetical protein
MTTENKMNKDAILADAEEKNMNKDATLEDAENGMRQRAGKNPSALASAPKALSKVSMRYDIDGDGKLDASEKAMRDMDTDNRGYLTNDQVYKVMLEQMKLQREVFGLKRMSFVFVAVIFMLALATLGTSFAAASLAKDTNVKNGILVVKGGDGVVGTSNVASTFTLTEVTLPDTGRRLAIEGDPSNFGITVTSITKTDAVTVAAECAAGRTVFLEETCTGGSTTIDVPVCPGARTTNTGESELIYTYTQGSGTSATSVTINCSDPSADTCTVVFSAGSPSCTAISVNTLGSDGSALAPGAYVANGIVYLNGILYLRVPIGSTDPWAFRFDSGSFITAAASNIVFSVESIEEGTGLPVTTNLEYDDTGYDTYADRVTWVVNGAISIGAESYMAGTMRSKQTITLGASAKCGRLEAQAAIVLGAGAETGPLIGNAAITVGAGSSCGPVRAGAAITVGAGATISILRPGPNAANTVGAGVKCEAFGAVPVKTWLVASQCDCDPKYSEEYEGYVGYEGSVWGAPTTLAARGDDCAA